MYTFLPDYECNDKIKSCKINAHTETQITGPTETKCEAQQFKANDYSRYSVGIYVDCIKKHSRNSGLHIVLQKVESE